MQYTLNDIPYAPENIGIDCFTNHEIIIGDNPIYRKSEMHAIERRFIDGLVRHFKPKSVLEIGVSAGGSSVVLLNALSGFEDYHITCIDISDTWYRDISKPVGFVVDEYFPSLVTSKRDLITGKDPVEVLPDLGRRFDFVLIDSAHLHPVESLNFLTVLPFLSEGAIVVLHDTALHMTTENNVRGGYASRILWSSIVGEKLEPKEKYEIPSFSGESGIILNSIGAIQVSSDTKRYIRNVFDSLMLHWEIYIEKVGLFRDFIEVHYGIHYAEYFDITSNFFNMQLSSNESIYFRTHFYNIINNWIGKPVIFYGAGKRMRNLLDVFILNDVQFNFPIWDKNANTIKDLFGIPVSLPDYNAQAKNGTIIVCTLKDRIEFDKICKTFDELGYITLSIEAFLN